MKNILIIGATSAIATACARRWTEQGATFFLVGRHPEKLAQVAADLSARGAEVHSHVLDLDQIDGHAAMLAACGEKLPHIDIALVAHGTLPDQGACALDADLAVREFTTNAVGVIAVLTRLANIMAAQRRGSIAVISSVAGDRGRASNYLYGAAKSAVTSFCSGLRGRLFKVNVQVLTVKPGFVDTPMTRDLALPAYLVVSADRVAGDILRALEKRRATLYTPWFWRYIMLAIVHVPEVLFKRLGL